MKPLITILLTVFFFGFDVESQTVTGIEPKTDREARGLSGLVRIVKIEREPIYSAPGEKPMDGGWIPSLTAFDREGNVEEFIAYDDKGNLDYRTISEFDSERHKITEKWLNADGTLQRTWVWSYDEAGNQIESKDLHPDGTVESWTKFSYDKDGKLTSHSGLNSDGVIGVVTDVSYDENGRILAESSPAENSKANGHIVHRYSNGGKTDEMEVITASGDLEYRYVSSDDKKNDHTEESYDGTGKLLDKQTYEYTRDAKGNWITEICSDWDLRDDKLVLIRKVKTTRTITYY